MNVESRNYLIASFSVGLGLIAGAGVLLLTTLEWTHLENHPQIPTILFALAMILLGFGCHRIDCLEKRRKD